MVGGWGGGANKLGPRVRLIKVKRGHKGGALVPEDWRPYEKRHQRAPFSLPETQKKGPVRTPWEGGHRMPGRRPPRKPNQLEAGSSTSTSRTVRKSVPAVQARQAACATLSRQPR